MALFRRKSQQATDPRPVITEFWSWWQEHRAEVLQAFAEQRGDDLARTLRPAVSAVDPRLEWEISGSPAKQFTLVVSSGGQPELRGVAERWMLAAPNDPEVDFSSTRRRDPAVFDSTTVTVDDYDIRFEEFVAGTRVDPATGKLDVVVHHPLYPLLEENHRIQLAFLGLDAALGEDDTQRWLGEVAVSADAPVDSIPLSSLGDVVDQLRPAPDQWAALQGDGARGPVFALVRRPFGRVDRPLADTHVRLVLSYPANGNGMPADPEVAADTEQLEERALAALGGDGPHTVHIGHLTGGGEVVVHFYVDGLVVDTSQLRNVAANWSRGRASIEVAHDPGWRAVAPLLG